MNGHFNQNNNKKQDRMLKANLGRKCSRYRTRPKTTNKAINLALFVVYIAAV